MSLNSVNTGQQSIVQQQTWLDQFKGQDNAVEQQTEQQSVSVFHDLDNQPQDGTISASEAQSTIFSQMQAGERNKTINVSSGSKTFQSLFETAAQKFQDIKYDTTDAGINSVASQIASQVKQFNTDAAALYDQAIQQRNSEAKAELSGDKQTIEYKDTAGQTFRTEKVTVEVKDGVTMYKDSNGKMIYSEDSKDHTSTTSVRDNNGNVISSNTRDAEGNITSTRTNTFNSNGQKTSSTYTTNGQTLTSTYTYNPNGTIASEVVTDKDGNVLETTKYDKNGNEVSYDMHINDGTTTTNIEQNFNKKGNMTSSNYKASLNDGSATSSTSETYRNNGARKTQSTRFTSWEGGTNHIYNTETQYRRGGDMKTRTTLTNGDDGSVTTSEQKFRTHDRLKYQTDVTTNSDGTSSTSKTKYRGSGITRQWNRTGINNGNGTTTAFQTNFNRDNEVQDGTATIRDTKGQTIGKHKVIVFDNKQNKVPDGYTAVKGMENRFSNANGQIFAFVEGDNGKPKPIRDNSAIARMHEARLKRELQHHA